MGTAHTIRIIGGSFKGKIIPYETRLKGAEASSQRLKKALFSIAGEDLTGKNFLDLFSGTGQIGLEALSRGAQLVIFNDADRKRYQFVKDIVVQWQLQQRARNYNFDAFRYLKLCSEEAIVFDIIFCDPPFEKIAELPRIYYLLLQELSNSSCVAASTYIFLQHYHANIMPDSIGRLYKKDTRKYGTNSLSIYRVIE